MRPEVVVHHLEQAKAALRVADQIGVDIQLRSAPGAAASAGVGYLQALGEAAGHELLIDCDDDAGLAMAALRAGCQKLLFSGSDEERHRLAQMAERSGARLRDPVDPSPPCLILSPEDDDAAIRSWLGAQIGT
ncbi:MAG: hypothetical protein OEU92_35245 [Alphaproteobacteria bacterium]|nr:hypothetical protein [Alphaproteobacteria bacterium]